MKTFSFNLDCTDPETYCPFCSQREECQLAWMPCDGIINKRSAYCPLKELQDADRREHGDHP